MRIGGKLLSGFSMGCSSFYIARQLSPILSRKQPKNFYKFRSTISEI